MKKNFSIKKANERPVGITILAILGYIGAGIFLLVALLTLFLGPTIASFLQNTISAAILAAGSIFLAIFLLITATLEFFIARGLWKGQKWAKIVTIVFASLGVLGALWNLPETLFSLIFNGFVIWYLGFRQEVKDFFR